MSTCSGNFGRFKIAWWVTYCAHCCKSVCSAVVAYAHTITAKSNFTEVVVCTACQIRKSIRSLWRHSAYSSNRCLSEAEGTYFTVRTNHRHYSGSNASAHRAWVIILFRCGGFLHGPGLSGWYRPDRICCVRSI